MRVRRKPLQMQRDLDIGKETFMYERTLSCMKKDVHTDEKKPSDMKRELGI